LDVCEARDVKGMYAKARAGEIKDFTGIDASYEPPENPDIVVETDKQSLGECIDKIWKYINSVKK
jgi:adenylylsulfate kinase